MAGGTRMTDYNQSQHGNFMLGLGAQKAGTSWIHKQLKRHPNTDFGCLKEYHVHDARTIPKLARFREININIAKPLTWIQPRTFLRQLFIQSPERYTDYFEWLLRRPRWRNRQIHLTGDITPSYALLDSKTLKEIRNSFEKRGIIVKPVFIMRDPIERLISSQRMKLRKQGSRDLATEVNTLRRRVKKGRGIRSDYQQTVNALEESFGLNNCFIGLFENLFTKSTYQRLCDYLDLTYQEPAWSEVVNKSATDNTIPDDLLEEIGQLEKSNLDTAKELFPALDFSDLWPTATRWCK